MVQPTNPGSGDHLPDLFGFDLSLVWRVFPQPEMGSVHDGHSGQL
jgi:hypothetical protein